MDNQFDLFKGMQKKKEGMELAAKNRKEELNIARAIARSIALSNNRLCHIDLVQEQLIEAGINLGLAAGSVFKGEDWEFTGKTTKTKRVTSHARDIKIWRLK